MPKNIVLPLHYGNGITTVRVPIDKITDIVCRQDPVRAVTHYYYDVVVRRILSVSEKMQRDLNPNRLASEIERLIVADADSIQKIASNQAEVSLEPKEIAIEVSL